MPLYCGIDLHSNNVMISIIDAHDQLINEQRLANDMDSITGHLSRYQPDLFGVVVESTYNWYWLVDGLIDQGYPVHLANTVAIQQYNGIKYTNDASDARYLAQLLRLGILPTGYIYPRPLRQVRDVLRRRLLLVEQRTAQVLSLQSLLARHTGQRLAGDKVKRLTATDLPEWLPDASALYSAQQTLALIHFLNQQIAGMEAHVERYCEQHADDYARLTGVPGIGRILGMTILLETGPIERFAKVGCYASYARCVPSDKISNGKSKGQGNTKNGNRYLGLAFVEAAHYASIWNADIKRYYQRKLRKVPKLVAKKTIANKLSRACYHMLKEHTTFDVKRAFG